MTLGERVLGMYGHEWYRVHTYCDCCAGDLPPTYIEGIAWDVSVAVCSGQCMARLMEVWAPTVRRYPYLQLIAGIVALAVLGWR